MNEPLDIHAIGRPLPRLEGPAKVAGIARYAYEHTVERPAYAHGVQATVARGRIVAIDTGAADAVPGVLAVVTHENAARLDPEADAELRVLQSPEIAYRGQFVAAVVAETPEAAREAAALVRVEYDEEPHDVVLPLSGDRLYAPERVLPGAPADTSVGDVEAALAGADVVVDQTYTTPYEYNNPMEPHAAIAVWREDGDADGARLTLYGASQGVTLLRDVIAGLVGLKPAEVRVISPYVGGGFGSKLFVHADAVLAVLAALACPGRPVKFALTRREMFAIVGYRTPTVQRVRLGADSGGRLAAIAHDAVQQTSKLGEFVEQTALPSRTMYAAPNRRTSHRLAALDVAAPTIMRAPGDCPGMFAAEVAMGELAVACGLDPVELRLRNEPEVHPESGLPFSGRHLVRCFQEGAERFGWQPRDPEPRARREDGWLVGTGMAASSYPANTQPGSHAAVRFLAGGRYQVMIAAADIGTGTWTTLTQIAADALEVPVDAIDLRIGDTAWPPAPPAGGSWGIASWGPTVVDAARRFRERFGTAPKEGDEAHATMGEPGEARFSTHSFGAQFAEVRVHADTGEIRVARLLGMFDPGRIVNPRTARSQLIGGMTMGLSMALHENAVLDPRFGHIVTCDLAEYHIAAHADVPAIDAFWFDEPDFNFNLLGARGIGEIGITGTAAAIANAAYHATGVRVRDLPITADAFL